MDGETASNSEQVVAGEEMSENSEQESAGESSTLDRKLEARESRRELRRSGTTRSTPSIETMWMPCLPKRPWSSRRAEALESRASEVCWRYVKLPIIYEFELQYGEEVDNASN